MLTSERRVELILLCGDHERTYREAADEFHRRHPDIPKPSHQTVNRLMNKFKTTGTIADGKRSGRPKTATNEDHRADVIAKLTVSPNRSLRYVARERGISKDSVHRIRIEVGTFPSIQIAA
ncbi:hypothetical protein C0J52_18392 [Blattella germanica]|nr:hypothetical protein C0J52_18392 [Blattella germanica]